MKSQWSVLRPVSPQNFFHALSSSGLFSGTLRARFEQQLDRSSVISCPTVPAVFGAVNAPSQWREAVIGIAQLEGWIVAQNLLGHFRVTMKPRPMQRCCAVLAERIYRQTGSQHQADSGEIVVPSRVGNLAPVSL